MIAEDKQPKSSEPGDADPTDFRDVQEFEKVLRVDDSHQPSEYRETTVVTLGLHLESRHQVVFFELLREVLCARVDHHVGVVV